MGRLVPVRQDGRAVPCPTAQIAPAPRPYAALVPHACMAKNREGANGMPVAVLCRPDLAIDALLFIGARWLSSERIGAGIPALPRSDEAGGIRISNRSLTGT